ILLAVAAIVSLAVGLYEDIALPEPGVARVKWVEGVAIIVAIMLVVTVGSVNDYQKEKQFRKLNAKKEDRAVKAVRSGITQLISVHDIQVGDILHIEPGDIIAADGVFIDGHNLRCDESAATGEADAVKKMNWRECIRFQDMYDSQHPHNEDDARSVSATSGLESPITPSDSHRRSEFLTSNSNNMGGQYLMPPSPASPTAASSSSSDKTKHGNVVLAAGAHLPDPFIISGSKVVEGIGSYVVTSIGVNSFHGKTMMALRTEPEETPLQVKLNDLAEKIAKLGGAAALLMLVVLLIKYFVGWKYHGVPSLPSTIVQEIMQILISTVTIVVVAVPEGLPLAVTLALAYATQRMLKDNNLVRVLSACETMGNATTICSDKTGTLTQNKMSVVAGTFGTSLRFLQDPPASRTDLIALKDLKTRMPKPVLDLVNQAIAVNSTAFESKDNKGTSTFVGSKTETALLGFSRELDAENYDTLRNRWAVEQLYPFSSERKAMATVIRVPVNGDNGKRVSYIYRAHIKGASELLVQCCGGVISTHDEAYSIDSPRTAVEGNEARVKTRKMTPEIQKRMDKIIQSYAGRSLRTIAMCWRDFETWPPHRNGRPIAAAPGDGETVEVAYDDLIADDGLILLGIVGIEDPLRDGVKEAVEQCQKASVFVRMVTGDNVLTAKSIAKQCGIYTHGGIVMEGPVFRQLPTAEMDAVIPRLQVLARSSPEDKRILVHRLKELGEIVAVTGDGTNDGPALKMADVGFSMGIAGTEVAKEASSIILMDDNFSSIVKAIMWGRCVNDAVKKFLQFQLTVNVTAVVLTFVSAVTSNTETSVLTAVQLLWVRFKIHSISSFS
ncbi:E1-E2 ATPase-domain-containing protein, partial [Jimgerdemannia flammicorona]